MSAPHAQKADSQQDASQWHDLLRDVRDRARDDISAVSDGRAQALFETTAEVPQSLMKAYEAFEEGLRRSGADRRLMGRSRSVPRAVATIPSHLSQRTTPRPR